MNPIYLSPLQDHVVGLEEVADLVGRPRAYLDVLRHRGKLPREDAMVSGRPLWWRGTILRWMEGEKS